MVNTTSGVSNSRQEHAKQAVARRTAGGQKVVSLWQQYRIPPAYDLETLPSTLHAQCYCNYCNASHAMRSIVSKRRLPTHSQSCHGLYSTARTVLWETASLASNELPEYHHLRHLPLPQYPSIPPLRVPKMMRQQLVKGFRQTQRLSKLNAARSFSSSHARLAEVELTIGTSADGESSGWKSKNTYTDPHCRWKENLDRGYAYIHLTNSPPKHWQTTNIDICLLPEQPAAHSFRHAKRRASQSPATATTKSS